VTHSVRVAIAGVNLTIHSAFSLRPATAGTPYEPFLTRVATPPGAIDVHIRLEAGNLPSTKGLTRIFDGQSWLMFQDAQFYYLEFQSGRRGEPLWLARFDHNVGQATVFCSKKLIHKVDGDFVITSPVYYPLDQILLMYVLAQRGGALIHAAGASIQGQGLIFPGESGAGKSTLSRQLASGQGIVPLSDDRVIVRKSEHQFRVFGTPWAGDARIARNDHAPLTGILFLCQGPANGINRISKHAALEKLMPLISIPWYNRELVTPMLSFCEDLLAHVPALELRFTPGSEVVQVLRDFTSA
jgi:hypothetical protein